MIKDLFGIGTEKNPVKIATSSELELALKKGYKFYELENDNVCGGFCDEFISFIGVNSFN